MHNCITHHYDDGPITIYENDGGIVLIYGDSNSNNCDNIYNMTLDDARILRDTIDQVIEHMETT